jgi:hypothetical protein
MKKKLISIFETEGPQSLNISNESFSKENIFEEFIDSSFFHKVNFINCSFEECELLGVNFNFCVFEFIYNLETKTARKALKNIWKNPKAKKEVLAGLDRMNKGDLLPRNQKNFKVLKH